MTVAIGAATAITPGVFLQASRATDGTSFVDTEELAVGDQVITDGTGFAEIAYADGSLTRMDVGTDVTFGEMQGGSKGTTHLLGVGRVWNRVSSKTAASAFTLDTSQVSVTATPGAAFSVQCSTDESCRFLVVAGSIDIVVDDKVTELVAPQAVQIEGELTGDPAGVPFDGAFADPWLLDNAARDAQLGFDDAAAIYASAGPQFGSIVGTFIGTRTVVSATCFNDCNYSAGDVGDRSYSFDIDCSSGVPCSGTVLTDYVPAGATETEQKSTPLSFDGETFSWSISLNDPTCFFDDGAGGQTSSGSIVGTITWSMSATKSEARNGLWVATELTGNVEAHSDIIDLGDCDSPAKSSASDSSSILVSR